jgi:hypothetical protein
MFTNVPEVVISVSKQPGTVHVDNKLEAGDAIFVWELRTGSVLTSYKPVRNMINSSLSRFRLNIDFRSSDMLLFDFMSFNFYLIERIL